MSVSPYDVCQNEASVGMWMTAAPVPEPISASTDTKATFENLGTHTTRPATRRATGRLRQRTSKPVRPPTQTDPATRWSQSKDRVKPRGDVWAA